MQSQTLDCTNSFYNSLDLSFVKPSYILEPTPDLTILYHPIPVFVIIPSSSSFLPISTSNYETQTKVSKEEVESVSCLSKIQDVKLQSDMEINFTNKSTETQKQIKDIKMKVEYSQNQFRNVMPNLIRLVLNFLSIKEKSYQFIQEAFPGIGSQTITKYYQYVRRFKNNGNLRKKSYVSEGRFKDILGLTDPQYFGNRSVRVRTDNEQLYKSIMRSLAMFYLKERSQEVIVSSPKMKKQLKNIHLSKRNRLISILKLREGKVDICKTQN